MTTDLIPIRVQAPAIPEPTSNLDEVQANIDALLAAYTDRVYTAEDIKGAKADRAQVNHWNDQLNKAAQALKKHYLAALDAPLRRINAMQAQLKECSAAIDRQVKAVEEGEREEKRRALEMIYHDAAGEDLEPLIPFDRVLEKRWLNKTVSLSAAGRELRKALETHREALRIIRTTCGEDAEACTTEYLRDLSLNAALNEYQRRKDSRARQQAAEAARRNAEAARAAAPVVLPPSQEEREICAEAAQAARAGAFVTPEGRLDTNLLQTFAQPQAEPERRRYRFWVEFTQDDIDWFKQSAAERGFRFGSIK